MDILFESKYTRSADFYREIYFYNYFKRPFNVLLLLFMGLLLAVNVFFSMSDSWDMLSNIAVFIGIAFFILYLFSYFIEKHIAKKRDIQNNSQSETKIYTLSVTEDKIIHNSPSGIEIEVRYAKIPKVLQSKHYLMFIADDSMVYAMPKDKFTVGNYDDLLKFLQSKGYKI